MYSPIPNRWRCDPPESLVAGDGPYAVALALVVGAEAIRLEDLRAGPEPNDAGGYPQVFENLTRAFLVVPESMSAAEVLRCHQAVWEWFIKLAPGGDQHELAFVFILPPDASKGLEDALAAGLGIARIVTATTGHAVWRRSGSLLELLDLLASIRPMDLLLLRARRTADIKHAAIAKLLAAAAKADSIAIREAARKVWDAFSGREYLLDVFCRPPSHRNGNLLRSWLKKTVTETATQEGWLEERKQLAAWLEQDQTGSIL